MTDEKDDHLVASAAQRNLTFVRKIATRKLVQLKVIRCYENMIETMQENAS